MKKLTYILIFLVFQGCSDFLEENPKGAIIGTNAINSVEGLDAALTGTYKGLLRTWSRGFLTSAMQGFCMGGDDLTSLRGGNKVNFRQFDQFNVNSGNGHLAQIWNGCYKTIQGANNIINNYENATGDKAVIEQIVGEARFLRALSYYWLVRGFGAVPVITTADFTDDLLSIEKTPVANIYSIIEEDLLIAEEFIGDVKRDPGRASRGSVKALLADVYLTMGGWPLNDQSKYALAASKAKEVIDNKGLYGFALVDLEVLWAGNSTAIGTTEEVLSFHTSVNYGGSANAFYGSSSTPIEENGWEDYFSEINFFYNFPAGKRKDITFYTVFTKDDGTVVPWEESAAYHPYYRKFMLNPNNNYQSSMPVHIIRYAHVLLTYAEAKARMDGSPNSDAYASINEVRQRAGLLPLSDLSSADFIQAVVDERAWEFAGEFTRWFDLVRLELVAEANSNKHPNDLQPIGSMTSANYTFPAPLDDALINPNL